ncbi:MAG TPA: hypothetical protein ENJ95_03490 [Bacteroidetes bacterium]|nr:hypothetical protein [Bacteroidota bacterium]
MKNFNHNHEKELDQTIMNWLSDHSATILIIAAVASFFITGFLEFFHYKEVFGKALIPELAVTISVMFAMFFQGVRCATIANSAKQFRLNRKIRGAFVLLVSLGVTIFCAYEAQQIATIWEKGHPEISGYIHLGTLCVVWAGWVLEIILVISVAGDEKPDGHQNQKHRSRPQNQEAFELDPFLNGNGAKH